MPSESEGPKSSPQPTFSPPYQRIEVKFLIKSWLTVHEYFVEFRLPSSTTLVDVLKIANRQLANDLSDPAGIFNWNFARGQKWVNCNVIFIKPRVLAGDLNQTIGELENDQQLCFSNSVDCYQVLDRYGWVVFFQIVGASFFVLFLIFLFAAIVDKPIWELSSELGVAPAIL